jgi:hypothetical protein
LFSKWSSKILLYILYSTFLNFILLRFFNSYIFFFWFNINLRGKNFFIWSLLKYCINLIFYFWLFWNTIWKWGWNLYYIFNFRFLTIINIDIFLCILYILFFHIYKCLFNRRKSILLNILKNFNLFLIFFNRIKF